MTLRHFGAWISLCLVGLGACSTSSDVSTDVLAPQSDFWRACGDIECAQVQVPVDYSRTDGPTMALAVYRRLGTTTPDGPPVVLVPDYRYGNDARELVEQAPLDLGSRWSAHTLISLSRRGTQVSPVPVGSEHLVSTRDVARDIEFVRSFLALDAMSAMGWGTGATALAVLALENPDSIARLVLDSPSHPLMFVQDRVAAQIAADNAMVAEALRWCVSHISCSMNANVPREFSRFADSVRFGNVDPLVTTVVVARAARRAFAHADPQSFFTGITQATDGNSATVLSTAGEGAAAWEVQIVCADDNRENTQLMSQQFATNHADTSRYFSIGDDHLVYSQCADLPEAVRPLKDLTADSDTDNVKAFVIVAENNPVVAATVSTALAQQFSWETYAVPLWRHLVVGYDDAVSQRALNFLLNQKSNS